MQLFLTDTETHALAMLLRAVRGRQETRHLLASDHMLAVERKVYGARDRLRQRPKAESGKHAKVTP